VSNSTSPLAERQNQPNLLRMLRAASVSHSRAQRLDALRLGVSLALAASGVVAAFASTAAPPVTILGGLWVVAYAAGIASWGASELRRAALLQEMFDVELFELPWNEVVVGEPLGAEEVSRLSQRCRSSDERFRDYYVVAPVTRPYDVLGCQQQNLGWGARVRRRYSRFLLLAASAWLILGILVGWVANLTVSALLLRWYVPSVGVVLLALDTYRSQRDAANERERVLGHMVERLRTAASEPASQAAVLLLALAREVQDVIFQTRRRHTRVPDLFYRRFRARDRIDFEVAMTELHRLLRDHAGPGRDPVEERRAHGLGRDDRRPR
jgi:hypothetical protein